MPDIYGTLTLINTINKAHKNVKRTERKFKKILVNIFKITAIVAIAAVLIFVLMGCELNLDDFGRVLSVLQNNASSITDSIPEFVSGIVK